jgi:hypothetical protein
MPITRCPDQSDDSLEEFYQWIGTTPAAWGVGTADAMGQLLTELNALFKQTQLWGVTSHTKLHVKNYPSTAARSYVLVNGFSGAGQMWYDISYQLPDRKCPWPNAQVTGETDSLSKAIEYILIAMRESEGWLENDELERLLAERNL